MADEVEYERPKTYGHDLFYLTDLLKRLGGLFRTELDEIFVDKATLTVFNKNDYPIGIVTWVGEEDQFYFEPYEERLDGSE